MSKLIFFLLMGVLVCALGAVTAQHRARSLVVQLEEEDDYSKQLDMEWRELQAAQSALATHSRVEKIAKQQLKMRMPENEQVRIINPDQPIELMAASKNK
jgi:cell division protein FtsL